MGGSSNESNKRNDSDITKYDAKQHEACKAALEAKEKESHNWKEIMDAHNKQIDELEYKIEVLSGDGKNDAIARAEAQTMLKAAKDACNKNECHKDIKDALGIESFTSSIKSCTGIYYVIIGILIGILLGAWFFGRHKSSKKGKVSETIKTVDDKDDDTETVEDIQEKTYIIDEPITGFD